MAVRSHLNPSIYTPSLTGDSHFQSSCGRLTLQSEPFPQLSRKEMMLAAFKNRKQRPWFLSVIQRLLSLCLCFCIVATPSDAFALDYGTNQLGSKYSDDGFSGFGGFSDQVGTARDRAEDRAKEAEKEGTGYRSQANELQGMGSRVGEDRKKIDPQIAQARLQDKQNNSGSSHLQKFLSTKYPEKIGPNDQRYALAMKSFKISNYGDLSAKGANAERVLLEKANEFNQRANESFERAAQGAGAAKQLGAFRQTALSRNAGMNSMKQNESAKKLVNGFGKNGQNLSGHSDGDSSGNLSDGSSKLNSFSSISGKGDHLPEGEYSLRNTGNGSGGNRSPASGAIAKKSSGSKAGESEKLAGANVDSLAQLDALPDRVFRSAEPILPKGFSLPSSREATPSSAPNVVRNESLDAIRAVLDIKEEDPVPVNPVSETKEVSLKPKVLLGSGFVLEDDSLFLRVRNTIVRAEKNGLLARP